MDIFEPDLKIVLNAVQGSVFHGVTASLFVRLEAGAEIGSLLSAFENHPEIDVSPDPALLGPIDSPSRDEILLGKVQPDGDGFWIWAVMDNLTTGGATNALRIAERILDSGPVS